MSSNFLLLLCVSYCSLLVTTARATTAVTSFANADPVSSNKDLHADVLMSSEDFADSTIVALADTVAARGFDAVLGQEWLAIMNIPHSGTAGVRMKRMTVAEPRYRTEANGTQSYEADRIRAVMVLTTDKRYIYFMRTFKSGGAGVSIDESGTVVGAVALVDGVLRTMPASVGAEIAVADVRFWMAKLSTR